MHVNIQRCTYIGQPIIIIIVIIIICIIIIIIIIITTIICISIIESKWEKVR